MAGFADGSITDDNRAAMLHLSTLYAVGDTVRVKGQDVVMCVSAITWSQRCKVAVVECAWFDARLQLQIECFKSEMLQKRRGGTHEIG
jgi:uncharacterized protein YodC (DUF2158 family)